MPSGSLRLTSNKFQLPTREFSCWLSQFCRCQRALSPQIVCRGKSTTMWSRRSWTTATTENENICCRALNVLRWQHNYTEYAHKNKQNHKKDNIFTAFYLPQKSDLGSGNSSWIRIKCFPGGSKKAAGLVHCCAQWTG